LYLGLFITESAAAQAYDVAALKIRGQNSQTNFPVHQYLDSNGELPVDEHLDDTIAELRGDAARQLLQELNDAEFALQVNACDNPADKIALIKQRVGPRRLAGLQEDLLVLLSNNSLAVSTSSGSHASALPNNESISTHNNGCLLGQQYASSHPWRFSQPQNCQHHPSDAQQGGEGLTEPELLNVDELNIPRMEDMWQLRGLHTMPDIMADRTEAEAAGAGSSISWLHQGAAFKEGSLPTLDTAAAIGDQRLASCGLSSSMLVANTVLNRNWSKVSTASSMVVATAGQASAVESVAQPAAAALQAEPTSNQQEMPRPHQIGQAGHDTLVFPGSNPRDITAASGITAAIPAAAAAAALQPSAVAALGDTPSLHGPGMSSSQGVSSITTLIAAGTPLAVDGSLSCVSLTWLQAQLPPHCQLQHIVHGTGGAVGMLYSQPSTAVAAGQLWGAAVWDGSCFRHSQLYGTAPEAISLCCSAMQLVVSCSS
jgi:hypothetical protein